MFIKYPMTSKQNCSASDLVCLREKIGERRRKRKGEKWGRNKKGRE